MATYRLQPARTGKYFALLCAIVALAIAAPMVALSAFSTQPKHTEPLVITTSETKWEQPIDGVDCEWDPAGLLLDSYICGNTNVQVSWVKDVEDSDHSLRRAVRAYNLTALPTEPITHIENNAVMVLPSVNTIAINLRSQDPEHAGEEFQVLLQGQPQQMLPLAEKVWGSFSDEPLPVRMEEDVLLEKIA
ncbi:hypothetical protein [Corynebacterium sp. J010B-136]|uniref:hypothetical protein n=1 Tax=Corynebacterium sp. J010B-136 TaxID=2099401 RepID=UPI000CF8EB37|nr:hypothetical protein [Corynebacterium sp. J010B-136]PQM74100.1 hypothetical protein C5Y44_09685 [Corynebacterium sp. J010B-136]